MLVVDMRRLASKPVSQIAIFLLLLSSSCALANDGARRSGRDGIDLRQKSMVSEGAEPWNMITTGSREEVAEILNMVTQVVYDDGNNDDTAVEEVVVVPLQQVDNAMELRRRSPTQSEAAQITTPPFNPLVVRQDQSQIDQLNSRIQSLQQSAQSALQSLSQSSRAVSQASQQLSQSSQQLSQQSQQLSQSSQQLSQSLQQATQSVQQLQQSVSAALSSGSSAFASCTNSASSVIALASNDAANQVTAALSQVTLAKTEADRQVQLAQGTAVSITQAAAIIVGASIGSSMLTIVIVLIVLRYRRKKKDRRERELQRDRAGSGGSGRYYGANKYGRNRPESYNSMADNVARRPEKEKNIPAFSPPSPAINNNSREHNQHPARGMESNTLEPAGEAITVNYARNIKAKDRKPVKLSDPPPAKPKKSIANEDLVSDLSDDDDDNNNNDDGNNTGDSGKFNLFPKVDPSPKLPLRSPRTPRRAAAAGAPQQPQQQTDRPNSNLQTPVNLQKWLQNAASVSPFGPLDGGKSQAKKPAGGLPGNVRLSDVKWPLQDSGPTRSDSNGGMAVQSVVGSVSGPAVIRNNEAAKTVGTRPSIKVGMGLPGPMRKLPLRDR